MAKVTLTSGPGALVAGTAAVAAVGFGAFLYQDRLSTPPNDVAVEQAVERPVAPQATERPMAKETVEAIVAEEPVARQTVPDASPATPPKVDADIGAEPAPAPPPPPEEAPREVAVAQPQPSATPALPGPSGHEGSGPQAQDLAPSPSFDLVRVAPDGQSLVAGAAPGGADVWIELAGQEAARGTADAAGSFVLFFDLDAGTEASVLELFAKGPDGIVRPADQTVIVTPPPAEDAMQADALAADASAELAVANDPAPAPPTAVEEPRALALSGPVPRRAKEATALPGPTETASLEAEEVPSPLVPPGPVQASPPAPPGPVEGTNVGVAPAQPVLVDAAPLPAAPPEPSLRVPRMGQPAAEDAPPAPAAPTVLLADRDGVRVLQPATVQDAAVDTVMLDVISYDANGDLILEGRSPMPARPTDRVVVYLDNRQVDTGPISASGAWRMPVSDVATGVYTLRVDQLDRQGNVLSRFETPFKREDPEQLARLSAERAQASGNPALAAAITVQPGFTLWGIATDRYGDGFQYVTIFDANANQIRDPDLIYPGQVFDLPDVAVGAAD